MDVNTLVIGFLIFLALFYAFGYATGNVVGIAVERKIALGIIVLGVFTRTV